MRIIAGNLGGRNFDPPRGHRTHPMSEKMRGALFAVLGDIEGLTVLDGFSGSGALSFEALSRGAKEALAIESDRQAQDTITQNITSLGLQNSCQLIRANTSSWADNNSDVQFDLVLCDPPYDDLQLKLLEKLATHTKISGTYVLSYPGANEVPKLTGLELLTAKSYGDSQLAFYRKLS